MLARQASGVQQTEEQVYRQEENDRRVKATQRACGTLKRLFADRCFAVGLKVQPLRLTDHGLLAEYEGSAAQLGLRGGACTGHLL